MSVTVCGTRCMNRQPTCPSRTTLSHSTYLLQLQGNIKDSWSFICWLWVDNKGSQRFLIAQSWGIFANRQVRRTNYTDDQGWQEHESTTRYAVLYQNVKWYHSTNVSGVLNSQGKSMIIASTLQRLLWQRHRPFWTVFCIKRRTLYTSKKHKVQRRVANAVRIKRAILSKQEEK